MRNIYLSLKKAACMLGLLGFTGLFTEADAATWYSSGSLAPNLTTSWRSNQDGSGTNPTDFATAGDQFVIQAGHSMATSADWAIGAGVKLQLNNGATLQANNLITFGSAASVFQINNGGTFIYNYTMDMATTLFAGTEIFNETSNFIYKVVPPTATSTLWGLDGDGYGNLYLDITNAGTNYNWGRNISKVQNDFVVNNTGVNQRLTTAATFTLTVGRHLEINGGRLTLSNGNGNTTVEVGGNLVQTGGTLDLGNAQGNGLIRVAGNVNVTGGTVIYGGSGTGTIAFVKSGSQTFASSSRFGAGTTAVNILVNNGSTLTLNTDMLLSAGGTVDVNGTMVLNSRTVELGSTGVFNVKSGGTLHSGTGVISAIAGGTFNLENGSMMFIGSPDGIAATGAIGNVQTGVRNFFVSGTPTYIYNGTVAQFTGTGLPDDTYGEVLILNPNGVTLSKSITIKDMLDISGGNFIIGNYDLSIDNNAYIGGGSPSSYVVQNGSGRLWINNIGQSGGRSGEVFFPVGTPSSYTPAIIQNMASTPDRYAVRVADGITDNNGTSVDVNVIYKTWHVEEGDASTPSNVTLKLQWNASDEAVNFNRSACAISHYTNGSWNRTNTYSVAQTGSVANSFVVARSGITSFSPFGVGDNMSPLPVELVAFQAFKDGKQVLLTWSTASEKQNKGFEVQVSADGVDYRALGFVSSKNPDSKSEQQYRFVDQEAGMNGIRYYRLKQVDLKGDYSYSPIRSVRFGLLQSQVAAYPNPFTEAISVKAVSEKEQTVQVALTNIIGRTVYSGNFPLSKGENSVEIIPGADCAAGVYLLTIQTAEGTETIRVTRK